MDPDDDVEETGVEMVLRPRTFARILALPSKSSGDQSLVSAAVWAACPTHSFRPEELEGMRKVAAYLKVDLNQLERMIEDKAQVGQVEAAFKQLGLE
jgi:hypothetical protein